MNNIYLGLFLWFVFLLLFVLFRLLKAKNIKENIKYLNDTDLKKFENFICPKCNHKNNDGFIIVKENIDGIILRCKNEDCKSDFLYNKNYAEAYEV
jgi:hypothetical protein